MLKKISSSKREFSKKPSSIQCSVCKSSSTKTAFFICDSGHVVCKNCQQSDISNSAQDKGDHLTEKRTGTLKNNRSLSKTRMSKDLASGDHNKKTLCKERKAKSECKINIGKNNETKNTSNNAEEHKEKVETIIQYKNLNYADDKSSDGSLAMASVNLSNYLNINMLPKLPNSRVCPRPIKCPVEECNKMVALDSVVLHFYFDHSKVPRLTLSGYEPRKIQLQPSLLSSSSQCLSIFLIHEENEVCLNPKDNGSTNNGNSAELKTLLLMGAKIQMDKLKNIDEKLPITPVSIRNVYTQTDWSQNNMSKKKNEITNKSLPYTAVAQNTFDNNEILILWICKKYDKLDSFCISVLRKDKKHGYNYVGEAIHIRNDQTPALIYQQANCLSISGIALNRLLDEDNKINIFVNILK